MCIRSRDSAEIHWPGPHPSELELPSSTDTNPLVFSLPTQSPYFFFLIPPPVIVISYSTTRVLSFSSMLPFLPLVPVTVEAIVNSQLVSNLSERTLARMVPTVVPPQSGKQQARQAGSPLAAQAKRGWRLGARPQRRSPGASIGL